MSLIAEIIIVLSGLINPIICALYFIIRSQKSKDINYVLCLVINLPIIVFLFLMTLIGITFWVDAVIFSLCNITICCGFVYKIKRNLWT